MAKGLPTINLHIASAQSCLSVLRTLLEDAMHADDRKQIDELVRRADEALDKANSLAADLRGKLDQIGDQL